MKDLILKFSCCFFSYFDTMQILRYFCYTNYDNQGNDCLQIPKSEIQRCVGAAIDEGYRHIDGAWIYQNEEGLGAGVNQKIKQGKIKREDIFITSKVLLLIYLFSNITVLYES